MATLAAISDNVRRRLGLGLGDHTVTLTYASIADGDTVTVHGIVLTCITGAAAVELAQFKKEANATATGDNLEDLIDAIFDSTTQISSSSSAGVVTITGARSVVTDNATGFVISSSSTQDEPPFTSDIDQWIKDGQLWLADMLVDEALMAKGTGSTYTVTCATALEDDYVDIDGIRLTARDAATGTGVADWISTGTDTQDAAALVVAINTLFQSITGVSATSASAIVTILGATTVTSSSATTLAVAATTASDDGLSKVFSLTGDGSSTELNLPTDYIRSSMVTAQIGSDSDLYRLTRVTLDDLFEIRHDRHDLWKVDSADKAAKYYAFMDDQIYFSAAPVSGGSKAKVYGIKEPQTTKTTECDLPAHLEPLLEDYAVIKAYEQKQRYDMAQALLGTLTLSIQVINTRYASSAARKRRR
ncbi:hypothetical protein LCGC14_2668590, partial [marine sediment metagenome]